jgi:hypothetical protein
MDAEKITDQLPSTPEKKKPIHTCFLDVNTELTLLIAADT